jgi:hypothetical protein
MTDVFCVSGDYLDEGANHPGWLRLNAWLANDSPKPSNIREVVGFNLKIMYFIE